MQLEAFCQNYGLSRNTIRKFVRAHLQEVLEQDALDIESSDPFHYDLTELGVTCRRTGASPRVSYTVTDPAKLYDAVKGEVGFHVPFTRAEISTLVFVAKAWHYEKGKQVATLTGKNLQLYTDLTTLLKTYGLAIR